MNIHSVIGELEKLGYSISLEGENIRCKCLSLTEPQRERVISLLDTLKRNKDAVIEYLKSKPLPYLDPDGSLVIPFQSDPKYHWWRGGQSVAETEKEVRNHAERFSRV